MVSENCSLFGSTTDTLNIPPRAGTNSDTAPSQLATDGTDSHADENMSQEENDLPAAINTGEAPSLLTTGCGSQKRCRTESVRQQRDQQQHPLLPPCGTSCKRKCTSKFKSDDRSLIHDKFWEMGYNERKAWVAAHVKLSHVKRRRSESGTRSCTRFYTLPAQDCGDAVVCKKFIISTLGLTCDKTITTAVSVPLGGNVITVMTDRRGKHDPSNKFSDTVVEQIKNHIESYHPSISHYRREHAPFRRYISPEISVRDMHQDYAARYPQHHCSYEFYRKTVKSMNISFVKLGEEECELCLQHEVHKNNNCTETACQSCSLWSYHMQAAQISRRHYQDDAERTVEDNEAVLSVDMQKVIMLPRMPGVKTCVFTRRLVCFHETFAPLGGTKRSMGQPLGILWHEGLSSRNAEDVMSCYAKAMRHPLYRDKSKFTFYADNCSAQNKNWTLFTGMIAEVNRVGGPDQVTVKYLEKGHTFMAADSFHAKIERAMRKMRNLYDFNDFKTAVGKHGTAVTMQVEDFLFLGKWDEYSKVHEEAGAC